MEKNTLLKFFMIQILIRTIPVPEPVLCRLSEILFYDLKIWENFTNNNSICHQLQIAVKHKKLNIEIKAKKLYANNF